MLALLLGLPLLLARLSTHSNPQMDDAQPQSRPVEVRRALPPAVVEVR